VAVLVTRPDPDNQATAAALRAKGFAVLLAPMLRFEAVAIEEQVDAHYEGVIATSANALRAIEAHPIRTRLLDLPLFTVGEHTADVARAIGFRDILVGKEARERGASALPALVEKRLAAARRGDKRPNKKRAERQDKPQDTLLYLAGADITRDLSGDLGERGFTVITHTTYRMVAVPRLPREVCEAFAADGVEAILHYSQRSARAFVAAARADGVEISALALPQCCISDAVAMVMRDAGASRVVVARAADETSMLDAVARVLRPAQR
jgi:uroporphyrinogen-III synthase